MLLIIVQHYLIIIKSKEPMYMWSVGVHFFWEHNTVKGLFKQTTQPEDQTTNEMSR